VLKDSNDAYSAHRQLAMMSMVMNNAVDYSLLIACDSKTKDSKTQYTNW